MSLHSFLFSVTSSHCMRISYGIRAVLPTRHPTHSSLPHFALRKNTPTKKLYNYSLLRNFAYSIYHIVEIYSAGRRTHTHTQPAHSTMHVQFNYYLLANSVAACLPATERLTSENTWQKAARQRSPHNNCNCDFIRFRLHFVHICTVTTNATSLSSSHHFQRMSVSFCEKRMCLHFTVGFQLNFVIRMKSADESRTCVVHFYEIFVQLVFLFSRKRSLGLTSSVISYSVN